MSDVNLEPVTITMAEALTLVRFAASWIDEAYPSEVAEAMFDAGFSDPDEVQKLGERVAMGLYSQGRDLVIEP